MVRNLEGRIAVVLRGDKRLCAHPKLARRVCPAWDVDLCCNRCRRGRARANRGMERSRLPFVLNGHELQGARDVQLSQPD